MAFTFTKDPNSSAPLLNTLQIFLLVLIVLGVMLLATQALWVPKVVDYLMQEERAPITEVGTHIPPSEEGGQ